MFGREVTIKLKANAAAELTRIGESDIIPILGRQKGFRDGPSSSRPSVGSHSE